MAGTANSNSLNITGSFAVMGEANPPQGTKVNKVQIKQCFCVVLIVLQVGRTTGWTQGTITATCVTTGVSGTRIVQLCQNFVAAGVAAGDSGSPVFQQRPSDPTQVDLVGILWGSSGGTAFVYSPIANVQLEQTELGLLKTS